MYCMSGPSIHRQSTDCLIYIQMLADNASRLVASLPFGNEQKSEILANEKLRYRENAGKKRTSRSASKASFPFAMVASYLGLALFILQAIKAWGGLGTRLVQWCNCAMVQRCNCAMVQRCNCNVAMVQLQWCNCTVKNFV